MDTDIAAPVTTQDIPCLGKTPTEIYQNFKAQTELWSGRRIVEAHLIAGPIHRLLPDGALGIVLDEIFLRYATDKEILEFEEGIELGQVQIYSKVRRMFESSDYKILHKATGMPLDPNSEAARRQAERLQRVYG